MGNALRDRRTPLELAAGQQVIELADKISEFARLAAVVESDLASLDDAERPANWRDATVSGRLEFGFADGREDLPVLVGEARTTVDAVCQRCLKPMKLTLEARLDVLLANGELEGYEVWELDEPTLRPADIVDEALVMAMPLSIVHEASTECRQITTEAEEAEDRIRPFAALRAQMEEENQE